MKKGIFLLMLITGMCLPFMILGDDYRLDNPLQSEDIKSLIENIVNKVAGVIGSVSIIMIIVSGILYLTSAGDPNRINNAKTSLIYAIIGIIVALAAAAVVEFIKTTLT